MEPQHWGPMVLMVAGPAGLRYAADFSFLLNEGLILPENYYTGHIKICMLLLIVSCSQTKTLLTS